MAAVAVTTHDLPTNPLGGLASVIDVSVAVVGDETSARRLASLLAHEGLTVAVEAEGPRQLPDVCLHGPPHVAVVQWRASAGRAAPDPRYPPGPLPRTRVLLGPNQPRPPGMRRAAEAAPRPG